jgi:hypothetical protein
MKCKISGKLMDDQNQPYWIPIKKSEATDKQKEEAKKNKNAEADLKMNHGYLICTEVYKQLEQEKIEPHLLRDTRPRNDSGSKEKVTAVKCPLTGSFVELSKIRKVYFC